MRPARQTSELKADVLSARAKIAADNGSRSSPRLGVRKKVTSASVTIGVERIRLT